LSHLPVENAEEEKQGRGPLFVQSTLLSLSFCSLAQQSGDEG
jgi:hypothetical protein